MNKNIKRSATLLIFSVLCITIVIGGLFATNKIIAGNMPTKPEYFGTFPRTPYWIFEAEEDVISTPVLKSGVLYLKTKSALYAINVSKKRVVWGVDSLTQSRLSVAPIVTQSSVVVVEGTSSLAAYSIDSGVMLWKTPQISGADSNLVFVETASVNNQYLYIGRYESRLTAYNLETGTTIWEHSLPGRTHPYTAANEQYVFLAADETVTIFDAIDGSKLWQMDSVGYAGPILLSGDSLYIADEEKGSLISLDINSRKVNWEANYQNYIRAYNFSCVSETEEHILLAARKLIMISKLDGKVLWSTDDLGILECPIIFRNDVYIRNSLNTLYSIDSKTGQETGRMLVQMNSKMKHDFFRGPVAEDSFLIIPFGDNRVFIYEK